MRPLTAISHNASDTVEKENKIGRLIIIDENENSINVPTKKGLIRISVEWLECRHEADIMNYWFNKEEQRQIQYCKLQEQKI